jgi:hypothetical protein
MHQQIRNELHLPVTSQRASSARHVATSFICPSRSTRCVRYSRNKLHLLIALVPNLTTVTSFSCSSRAARIKVRHEFKIITSRSRNKLHLLATLAPTPKTSIAKETQVAYNRFIMCSTQQALSAHHSHQPPAVFSQPHLLLMPGLLLADSSHLVLSHCAPS